MNSIEKFMDYKVETISESAEEGVYSLAPLPTGFGDTLGNILRRVLLSSTKGAAISELRMEGVPHQFATVEGMREDIIHFILNLKKVRFTLHEDKPVVLILEASGIGDVTAANIKPNPAVEIVNPSLYLASLTTKKAKIEAQILVEPGYGYVAREALEHPKIGVLPIDSFFSPVRHVSYEVVKTRVGEMTDLDKLVLTVRTDKTVAPYKAVVEAATLLVSYFARISGQKVSADRLPERVEVVESSADKAEGRLNSKEVKIALEDLDLPLRTINSLKRGKIETLGDLVALGEEDLYGIRGLGETSIEQIRDLISREKWK